MYTQRKDNLMTNGSFCKETSTDEEFWDRAVNFLQSSSSSTLVDIVSGSKLLSGQEDTLTTLETVSNRSAELIPLFYFSVRPYEKMPENCSRRTGKLIEVGEEIFSNFLEGKGIMDEESEKRCKRISSTSPTSLSIGQIAAIDLIFESFFELTLGQEPYNRFKGSRNEARDTFRAFENMEPNPTEH